VNRSRTRVSSMPRCPARLITAAVTGLPAPECVCVCVHVMYMDMFICMYACLYVCLYVHTCYVLTKPPMRMYAWIYIRTYLCTYDTYV
jgi:hypothetical protein